MNEIMYIENPTNRESLVSIIIPTYNRSAYLKDAIESVVQQTYQNIEIIVSDDYSTESPQATVESFKDKRIRFRRNTTNLGVALNVTKALKEVQGKYIAYLNDDDIWNKDFLEKLVPHLDFHQDVVLAFCDHYIIDSDGKINYPDTEKNTAHWKRNQLKEGIYKPFWEIGLIHKAVFAASSTVIRKDAVEWDQLHEAGVFWDYYISYLACCSGLGAYYCPERLTQYRVHDQSETMLSGSRNVQAKLRKAKAGIFCYDRFMRDERLKQFKPYFAQQWAHANTTMAIALLRAGQIAEARPYLLRALSQQKFNLRTLAALTLSFTPQPLARKLLSSSK
ncbi:glycosyl transferase family 2 [Crinalium epipsammum PCC 9333]|uniref:Glycosyl transferase family 2 n=1 Tax=Crinalium epipsammum PCC 9333 TaxID=1173022 RepID=K9VZS6_9CYAN|nr:glycosyltransferase family 2 protein [Crinalium epipsammum]AFZ13618.1 glycosyl transferase family 2 [Crinalium epipsammum PCC 9333]